MRKNKLSFLHPIGVQSLATYFLAPPKDEGEPVIKRPRGTRDFTPEEMDRRNQLLACLRNTTETFGYKEVNLPTFEHIDLFTMKSGQGIIEQMYTFTDKSGRQLALRPEITASAMRFYVAELQNRPKPLKIYYFSNCFRYERPQKGRFREFWQFGAEFIGSSSELAVAELVALAWNMVKNASIKDFNLRLGYLDILKSIIEKAKLSNETFTSVMVLIDKKNTDGLENLLYENEVSPKLISDILLLTDHIGGKEVLREIKRMEDEYPAIKTPLLRFSNIIDCIDRLGVEDYIIDPGISRGLDYYTGMVFEIDAPNLGAEKQICGGGEYSLAPLFGGREVATSGFAIGFDRILLALETQGHSFEQNVLDIFLLPVSKNEISYTVMLASELRDAGFKVDMELRGRTISKAMRYANAIGTSAVGIIGEDEVAKGTVSIKDMATGEQENVRREDIVSFLKARRNSRILDRSE